VLRRLRVAPLTARFNWWLRGVERPGDQLAAGVTPPRRRRARSGCRRDRAR
jgi:hypothetical protein